MSYRLQNILNIVYSLTVATFVVTVFGFSLAGNVAFAQNAPTEGNTTRDYGLSDTAKDAGLIREGQQNVSLSEQIGRVIRPMIGLSGSIFLALVIYAGVMWMTAAGNEDRVNTAKKILQAAVIGLIIVVMAYAITNFIGNVFVEKAPV